MTLVLSGIEARSTRDAKTRQRDGLAFDPDANDRNRSSLQHSDGSAGTRARERAENERAENARREQIIGEHAKAGNSVRDVVTG